MERLPDVSAPLFASFTLTGPRRVFGKHEIYHYWIVEVEDHVIAVSARGHFYRPSTGGDSFTSFRWIATPGRETECQDFGPSLGIVDDAKPFGTEIEELDLTEPGYSISVDCDGEEVNSATEDDHDFGESTSSNRELLSSGILGITWELVLIGGLYAFGRLYTVGVLFYYVLPPVVLLTAVAGFCEASRGRLLRHSKDTIAGVISLVAFGLAIAIAWNENWKWGIAALMILFAGFRLGRAIFAIFARAIDARTGLR